jgi:hypothetical protein
VIWLAGVIAVTIVAACLVFFARRAVDALQPGQDTSASANREGHAQPLASLRPLATSGPLRVSARNPRYFADRNGKIVYLVGSHTWTNLQDGGGSDPPPRFDYAAYLDFLHANNHNFFRLWAWEQPRWTLETSDDNYWIEPMPYMRTGPGKANDGKLKFDLTKFNPLYFDRLRKRVAAAKQRGMYVSVMLFNGWSVRKKVPGFGNPWKSHPFNAANNINGINGDANGDDSGEEAHSLSVPSVTELQQAYVRKVIDTVGDLDNVLHEISNESQGRSWRWQYHIIEYIKRYQASRPLQHPVGMTVDWPDGTNSDLWSSPADWVSPNGSVKDRPPARGRKVIVADTDHFCGKCGDRSWVWKSFTSGENPIFMDGYDGSAYGQGGKGFRFGARKWVSLRANLGYTLTYASRVDLGAMTPRGDLSSTGYALANPSGDRAEYLVYLPRGGNASVDLSATRGQLAVEWFDPGSGNVMDGGSVAAGGIRSFTSPFETDAVLYLRARPAR